MTFILFQTSLPPGTSSPLSKMPRKFVSQGLLQTDRTALENAFKHRVETGCSIRNACKQFGVKVMTLQVSSWKNSLYEAITTTTTTIILLLLLGY